jgi:hypothetical protein
MVAEILHPQPLAPLSPDDALRLEALFENARSPFKLARALAIPLHEVLLWIDQPPIQHHIDAIQRLEDAEHRAAAIRALRQTIDTTEDPVERRRAAVGIIRALARPRPPRPDDDPHKPAPPPPADQYLDPGHVDLDADRDAVVRLQNCVRSSCNIAIELQDPTPDKIVEAWRSSIDPPILQDADQLAELKAQIAASPLFTPGRIPCVDLPSQTTGRSTASTGRSFQLPDGKYINLILHCRAYKKVPPAGKPFTVWRITRLESEPYVFRKREYG